MDTEKTFYTHQGAFRWNESDVRKLRAAVLQNAIDSLARTKRTRTVADLAPVVPTPDRELTAWIKDDNGMTPFGFVVCCGDLSLDVDAVREALHKRFAMTAETPTAEPPRFPTEHRRRGIAIPHRYATATVACQPSL